jgi:putative transposase
MPFCRFRLILSSFLQRPDLPFADVLSEEAIEQAFADAGMAGQQEPEQAENIVYTAAVTLWAFLSQVLYSHEQRSCVAATARVVVLMAALSRECSDNTGAYCRARARLPLAVIERLTLEVADGSEQRVPRRWLWRGRHVHLVDGTTVGMTDTAANQAAFPQARTQKPGLGFPIARMVVLLSLATAMVTGMAMGRYKGKETGEPALLRELFDRLRPGDVVLGDRCYCSYFMIALLLRLKVDAVVRLHQFRPHNFCRGRDHMIAWERPQKPDWMDQETYDQMPETLQVREVHVQVNQPGFRVDSLIVVTTLTDAERYTKDDVAELYHRRWLAELDIRALKVSLGMDVLRCKTPDMVRKEIWTCLLAYNLIRQSMLEAALAAKLSPRQLSFTAAMQKIAASWATLAVCDTAQLVRLIAIALRHLAGHRVGDRSDRVEPRAIKRRPKHHKLLTKPRKEAREALIAAAASRRLDATGNNE